MRNIPHGRRVWFVLAALLAITGQGCGANGIIKPMTANLRAFANPFKPNANGRILAESVFGDSTKSSTISGIDGAPSSAFGYFGRLDGSSGVGVLGPNGNLVSFVATTDYNGAVCALSGGSPAPGGFLVPGWRYLQPNSFASSAVVSLYANSGVRLDQIVVASDTSYLWFRDIATVTDTTFIAVGAETRHGVDYPYLALIGVTPDRHLALRASKVLDTQAGRWWYRAVVLPPVAGDPALLLWTISSDATGAVDRVDGVRATLPDLADAAIQWSHGFTVSTGPQTQMESLARLGDNVFVVGRADDNRKQPPPTNGGYWQSGLAASFARDGALRWTTEVGFTPHQELFHGIAATPTELYVVGNCAGYVPTKSPKSVVGYGLVTRIEPNTGQVLENLVIGQATLYSGFNSATYLNGALTCAGYTAWELNAGPHRAWLCRVDLTPGAAVISPALSSAPPAPEPGGAWLPRAFHSSPAFVDR